MTIQEQFGQIDIYLFDQILRGNIRPGMRLVDAGCGQGRNLVYLLGEGYEVFGVDANAGAIKSLRESAAIITPGLQGGNFQVAAIEAMPFPDAFADVVVCTSVMHFARDEAHFDAMIRGLWRVLRPEGMLFCRLGSTIGMEFEQLGRREVSPAGWGRVVSGGRGDADGAYTDAGRGSDRPPEDDGGAGTEVHDDLGGAEAIGGLVQKAGCRRACDAIV